MWSLFRNIKNSIFLDISLEQRAKCKWQPSYLIQTISCIFYKLLVDWPKEKLYKLARQCAQFCNWSLTLCFCTYNVFLDILLALIANKTGRPEVSPTLDNNIYLTTWPLMSLKELLHMSRSGSGSNLRGLSLLCPFISSKIHLFAN